MNRLVVGVLLVMLMAGSVYATGNNCPRCEECEVCQECPDVFLTCPKCPQCPDVVCNDVQCEYECPDCVCEATVCPSEEEVPSGIYGIVGVASAGTPQVVFGSITIFADEKGGIAWQCIQTGIFQGRLCGAYLLKKIK